jgi:hypothetical protein
MSNQTEITNEKGEIIIYQNPSGEIKSSLPNGEIWLRQLAIAQFFGIDRTVVSKYIKAIFRDQELDKSTNVQKTQLPDSDVLITMYSFDVLLAVGYRTSTPNATKFRQWVNTVLKSYITK